MSEEDVNKLIEKYKIVEITLDGKIFSIKNNYYQINKDIKSEDKEVK